MVDESLRQRAGGEGSYFLAVARLNAGRAAEARAELRRALRPRQLRFHWRTEWSGDRLAFLQMIAGLEIVSTVVYQHPVRRRKQEQARVRCLWEAMGQFAAWDVQELIIESRQEPLDIRDRREIIAGQHAGLVASDLPYRHDVPKQEPLLWIADAIVGAVAAAIADGDERYVQLLPERCRQTRAVPAPLRAEARAPVVRRGVPDLTSEPSADPATRVWPSRRRRSMPRGMPSVPGGQAVTNGRGTSGGVAIG